MALLRDVRGNTLALMAAAMIPLCAFAGTAIDIGRLYVVRTRLQTACDSGALAGRKFLDTNTAVNGQPLSTSTATSAGTQALAYFNNNFGSSWDGTAWYTGTPSFSASTFTDSNATMQVQASASATVPMTLMQMFGAPTRIVKVTCQASFNTPDTDVMFVIDTTGSMSCQPSDNPNSSCGTSTGFTLQDGGTDYYTTDSSSSKLQAVRDAVKTFYDTLAANMTVGTNVRYGFVPYSTTVNVGKALYGLSTSYLASNWTYQSRYVTGDYNQSSTSTSIGTPTTSATCTAITQSSTRSPATAMTYNSSTGTATSKQGSWGGSPAKCTVTTYTIVPQWTYKPISYSTTNFLQTINNGGTVSDPSKVDGTVTAWQGCIDQATSGNYNAVASYNINSLPDDMNPDFIPGTSNTPWAPMWPAVTYGRNGITTQSGANGVVYAWYSTNADVENGDNNMSSDPWPPQNNNFAGYNMRSTGYAQCGQEVRRLGTMTQTDVINYMTGLKAHGGTYHDTGMIWGLRMISPQGIFANDTAKWPGHADPKRVMVFLTDGVMSNYPLGYTMTGIESLDKRVRGTATDNLENWHNARFLAQCAKAQQKNIQVWVVAVGQSLTTPLQTCVGTAHPERAIFVNSSTDLSTAFKSIATAVAMLRVSQ